MLKTKNFIFAVVILCSLLIPSTVAYSKVANVLTAETFTDLYDNVIDSVVTVVVEVEGEGQGAFINNLPPDSPFNKLFKDKGNTAVPKAVGKGSGYIVTEEGLVYTNHHVIYGAAESRPNMKVTEILIVWHDQKYRNAKVIASDPVADVAILQIERKDNETFKALKFADSNTVKPGAMVAAIGTPLDHPFSITSGIISGVGRPTGQGVWVTMLQTDAVINKGNSGGPLFNLNGEIIGMNTLIMSPSGFFIGIGYAVPSNIVMEVAAILLEHGEMVRPWIGVQLSNLSEDFKERFGLEIDVEAVVFLNLKPDGPASKSGFQSYDIILLWDGETINSEKMIDFISDSKPGDTFTLRVRRVKDFENNVYEDITLVLTIGAMPTAGMK